MSTISEKIKGDFIHMVFFWLKNPNNQNDREVFRTALEEFIDNNPQAVATHIGEPANTKRTVIDSSFTFSLIVTFPDLKTQDAYQVDPTHLLFIEKGERLWEKVLIYDSILN
jgi:hypothetical protein